MRNRRNTRKRNVVLDTITNRNFIIIVSILLAVIIVAEGVIQIRKYQDRKLLAKQAEELEKQTGEIFTAIENNLTNPSNNGETTVITRTARISAVGDILCQMDMIDDAKIDDGYDFSHMFTGISKFVKNSDLAIGTLETNFIDGKYSGVGKYNSPVEFLKAVKDSGIGLVSLAHNHVLDYGTQGLETTISKIKEQNVEITGIKNKVDESNESTLDEEKTKEQENSNFTGNIKEINGIKVAFLGYTYGLSNENEELKYKLKTIDDYYQCEIEKLVKRLEDEKLDEIKKLKSEINFLKSRALINPKKITNKQVNEVTELRALGLSYRKIADKTSLGTTTICRIINGEYE